MTSAFGAEDPGSNPGGTIGLASRYHCTSKRPLSLSRLAPLDGEFIDDVKASWWSFRVVSFLDDPT